MVTHSVIIALLAATPAASPESSPAPQAGIVSAESPERTSQQLRDAVHAAMRHQATAERAEQGAAIRALADLFREVNDSSALPPREKLKLRTLIRSRLMRASKALERELNQAGKADAAQPRPKELPPAKRAVLAQAQGNPAAQGAVAGGQPGRPAGQFGPGAQVIGAAQSLNAQTNQNAQQLIDLIQNTIAPASWDTRGGLGTIMYFAPAQVLVIRQTDGVHGKVGQAIQGLRGN